MSDQLIAVVGLGYLGRGIAACLLMHDFRVLGYDTSAIGRAKAEECIAAAIDEAIAYGAVGAELAQRWRQNYQAVESIDAIRDATFVIESVVEDAALKREVFDAIEKVVGRHVPIASNTSAIPISAMQATRRSPERFLGMHWAEPAYATRFLELIRGTQTSEKAFEHAVALAQQCGKEPSFVEIDIPGFIANRLGYAMYREAFHLLAEGVADAETIDRSFRNSIGLWAALCGPFRWIDITGGPALYAKAMASVLPSLNSEQTIPAALEQVCKKSASGSSAGGVYEYAPGEAQAWGDSFHRHAWAIKKLVDELRPQEKPQ